MLLKCFIVSMVYAGGGKKFKGNPADLKCDGASAFRLMTTDDKFEGKIKQGSYDCEGATTICNGEKVTALCNGKKSSTEKVIMKCKCNYRRGRCKLKLKPNLKLLEKRQCKKIVTTTTLPPTTTTTIPANEKGRCYLDPNFYTNDLKCTLELGVNGLFPEGTICSDAMCHVGGVYMAVIRRQSGVCKCTGSFCRFVGIQNCESLYNWLPYSANGLQTAEKYAEDAPEICRTKTEDASYVGIVDNGNCYYKDWHGDSHLTETFDLVYSNCEHGSFHWVKKADFFRYNEHAVISSQPGIAVCRIRNTKIYGWAYGETSPCFSHAAYSFRRILERQGSEIEVLTPGSCGALDKDEYLEWTAWTECSNKCGSGSRQRTQTCAAQGCSLRGEIHLDEEYCSDLSQCPVEVTCPIFFGEGFFGHPRNARLLARKCEVNGQNITSLADHPDGLPEGTSCSLFCHHEERLDLDENGVVTCTDGQWDKIPKCISRGIFMERAPDDKAIIEFVINYSLYDYSHIATNVGSRLTWHTGDIVWIKGNHGCINFFAFLRLYSDFDDTNFMITIQYKKSTGEVREEELWSARDYVANMGMVFYEEYPVSINISPPHDDEDYVNIRFDQFNNDNFAFFKDPQSLHRFSLSKFGKCGKVNCGPLILGYEQTEQHSMNSNCSNGKEGDQCVMKCDNPREKSSSQARCQIDGRWHQPSFDDRDDPNGAIFPHCVPKECAAGVPTRIENGKISCETAKGFMNDGLFFGQVGSKCQIKCDEKFIMAYNDEASNWDKQKKLDSNIECMFSQKFYSVNGGMWFDVINWSGSTKFACVPDTKRSARRLNQLATSSGCKNNPENGILLCDDKLYEGETIPVNKTCQLQCFDSYSTPETNKTCTKSALRLTDLTEWSSTIQCA